jgi:hypothetical protein
MVARFLQRHQVALDLGEGGHKRVLPAEIGAKQRAMDRDAGADRVGARVRRSDGRVVEELQRSVELTP